MKMCIMLANKINQQKFLPSHNDAEKPATEPPTAEAPTRDEHKPERHHLHKPPEATATPPYQQLPYHDPP